MSGARVAVAAAVVVALAAAGAHAKSITTRPAGDDGPSPRAHVVERGESLWTISRRYGCLPADLKRANGLDSDRIYPGRKLKVPVACGQRDVRAGTATKPTAATPATAISSHRVRAGDTLFAIARRYDTTVDDLKLRNGLIGSLIRPGQTLDVAPGSGRTGRAIRGQSIGRAFRGRLKNATRLPRGAGYTIRRPKRTYGANHAVFAVRRVVAAVRRRHPKIHTIAIGDLSARRGGKLSGHHSHQSGRDIDIGLVFKKRPRRYPKEFVVGTARNLDLAATWTLVSSFAAMADADNGVERIFLGYRIQKLLYRYARKHGVPQRRLRRIFQYPDGRHAARGIVRHEPAHDDHLHVRFKCPKGDTGCR